LWQSKGRFKATASSLSIHAAPVRRGTLLELSLEAGRLPFPKSTEKFMAARRKIVQANLCVLPYCCCSR
jgi:hypothetical protein